MKPGSNSVEDHPQLSHNIHPVDGALVGAGSMKYFVGGVGDPRNYPLTTQATYTHNYTQFFKNLLALLTQNFDVIMNYIKLVEIVRTKGQGRKFKCRLTQMNISDYLITFKAILNSHIFPSCKCVHMGMEISLTCQIGGLPQGLKFVVNPLWNFDLDCLNIFYSQYYQSLAPWQFLPISCTLAAFVQSLFTCKKDRNLQSQVKRFMV